MADVQTTQVALSTPDESAEDLVAHNVPDLLANEQTWPTEEEMDSAPAASGVNAEGRRVKRVPKGTSAYQAAWIVDEDEDVDDFDETDGASNDEGLSGDEENGEPRGETELGAASLTRPKAISTMRRKRWKRSSSILE